jgi:hypothetical protein
MPLTLASPQGPKYVKDIDAIQVLAKEILRLDAGELDQGESTTRVDKRLADLAVVLALHIRGGA